MAHKRRTGAQTSMEFVMLVIIIIGAFLGIQNYMKRGLQGRWKDAIDSIGDQYDPRTAVTDLRHTTASNTNTEIVAMDTEGGFWTKRTDRTVSTDKTTGFTSTGAY